MTAPGTLIAADAGADSARVQALFKEAVEHWRASGLKVVGLIEETHGLTGRVCSAGVLRDITSGVRFPIFLETPPSGTSCHVDGDGALRASASLTDQVPTSDVVVLSKFGKLVAGGGGLIGAFEAAKSARKCLLTTVSDKHRDAWNAFAPGASVLPATTPAIEAWLDTAYRP